MQPVTLATTLSTPLPHGPFDDIKRSILGARYQLTLTFIGKARAKRLNEQYRQMDYVPNVLSFPLTETTGEIYICPAVANTQAKNFDMTPEHYQLFLFIHGCLHLKGLDHGPKMDTLEATYIRKYKLQ